MVWSWKGSHPSIWPLSGYLCKNGRRSQTRHLISRSLLRMSPGKVRSVVRVSAVVLRNDIRKRGTRRFVFPGGKPEVEESARDAAVREVAEELAVELDSERLHLVGIFSAPAANELNCDVEATVYEHPSMPVDRPNSEIDELRWQLLDDQPYPHDLAPLLAQHVFPVVSHPSYVARKFTG